MKPKDIRLPGLDTLEVSGRRVLLRLDLNVPLDKKNGQITDTTRIDAALPTIHALRRDTIYFAGVAHTVCQGLPMVLLTKAIPARQEFETQQTCAQQLCSAKSTPCWPSAL